MFCNLGFQVKCLIEDCNQDDPLVFRGKHDVARCINISERDCQSYSGPIFSEEGEYITFH